MRVKEPLTIGQFKKWCFNNNISDDTPIGIYLGDSERGDIAFGVIGDTKNIFDDDDCIVNFSETTGEHCYCKNVRNIFKEAKSSQIVMITDGYHSESF